MASLVLFVGLASCSGDGKPLTASAAKSALKKEAFFAKDSQVREFETGYQEVTEEYLNSLAQLQAAGVIEYTVETAIEKYEESRGNWWSGYSKVTLERTHYFADVKLTKEGEKLVVEEPTTMRADEKKDFEINKDYEEKIPEYMSAYDKTVGTAPESEEPEEEVVAAVEEEVEVVEDSYYADTVVAEAVEETPAPAPAKPKAKPAEKANPNADYEAKLDKVNTTTVNVLLGHFEIVKVKEVLCTEDMFKAGHGSCTLLFKFVDKTPFGFVFGAPQENFVMSEKVDFRLYQDLGWVTYKED